MKRKLALPLMRLAIVGVALYAAALVFAGPVRLAYWHATGQAPLLSWSEALQAKTNSLNQLAVKARIAAGARYFRETVRCRWLKRSKVRSGCRIEIGTPYIWRSPSNREIFMERCRLDLSSSTVAHTWVSTRAVRYAMVQST